MSQYRRQPKMWLIIFATFCISLSAGRVVDGEYTLVGEGESPLLPDKYTVKATKTSLTSNLVEDFVYWKSYYSGRVDSNQGYVKNIVKENIGKDEITSYEIYPRTDENENVEYVCTEMEGGITLGVPGIEDKEYELIGNETVLGHEATKFECESELDGTNAYYALWATETSVGNDSIWIPLRDLLMCHPVFSIINIDLSGTESAAEKQKIQLMLARYEVKEYNSKLGALTKHEIWDFYEFDVDFDEEEVYDVSELGCDTAKTVKVTRDSDAVVKELMFMNPENKEHVDHVFDSFKSKFNPKYAHEEEHNLRKSIFQQNMRLISSTNRQNLGYKLGVNKFADRTPEEMKTGYRSRSEGRTGNVPFPYTQKTLDALADTLPEEVDLRVEGLVSPVKNQEDCGSCWTFGTTSAVEGALARVNGGRLMGLSNQALIDCAWAFGGSGCEGGSDDAAYAWMMEYGLPTEEEYGSYENKNGYCHIENMTTLYPIKGFTDVTPTNKEALKVAVLNHGPLSVSLHVTDRFSLYSSGVYYDATCNPNKLNHEVTLVGYGVEYGELFWVLKNSWGPDWGVEGYMLISAKRDCGVTTEPTYVVF